MLHMWHVYAHASSRYAYMLYMSNLVDLFLYGTSFVVISEVELQMVVLWHIYAKMVGLYAHFVFLPCELYFSVVAIFVQYSLLSGWCL